MQKNFQSYINISIPLHNQFIKRISLIIIKIIIAELFKNSFVHQNKYPKETEGWTKYLWWGVLSNRMDSWLEDYFFFFLSHLQGSNGHGVIASSKLVARGLVTPVSSPISWIALIQFFIQVRIQKQNGKYNCDIVIRSENWKING